MHCSDLFDLHSSSQKNKKKKQKKTNQNKSIKKKMPIFFNLFLFFDFVIHASTSASILTNSVGFLNQLFASKTLSLSSLESHILQIYAIVMLSFALLALRFLFSNATQGKIIYCQIGSVRSVIALYLMQFYRSIYSIETYNLSILITVSFFVFHTYFGFFYAEDTFYSHEQLEKTKTD